MKTRVATRDEIERALVGLDLLPAIEAGFVAYSRGEAVVPPVGELLLPGGEVHIKYGYIKGDEFYVIKAASGFYENPKLGLASSNGLMLLFRATTGEPVAVLLDEGKLTDIRTAVAGAICAKYLAPEEVRKIGIVGTGTQARLQLFYLKGVTPCREVLVWGRRDEALTQYREDMAREGFSIEVTTDASRVLRECDLVVTCTPATTPLLSAADLHPGLHITAVGSDTPEKQELDAEILARADLVVADSRAQCQERGEIHHALSAGLLREEEVVELGEVIAGDALGRTGASQITVADLTGVAVQDIKIAVAVYQALA